MSASYRRSCTQVVTRVGRAETTRIALAATTSRQLNTAAAIRAHYADLNLDLADAVAVVVAAEDRTNVVLTLDRRDFRALRPLTEHEAFRLLPDDL